LHEQNPDMTVTATGGSKPALVRHAARIAS
jgi:hypothetical protein